MAFWLSQYWRSFGANFGEVAYRSVYRGAVPSEKTLKKLRELGVTTILDLRDRPGEEEHCGFECLRIPMADYQVPRLVDVRAALDVMRRGNVFVHCQGGRHRTGVMTAVYRVVVDGWSKEKAWREAEEYGWYDAFGHKPIRLWFEAMSPGEQSKRA